MGWMTRFDFWQGKMFLIITLSRLGGGELLASCPGCFTLEEKFLVPVL
jgi:hypothetical protein